MVQAAHTSTFLSARPLTNASVICSFIMIMCSFIMVPVVADGLRFRLRVCIEGLTQLVKEENIYAQDINLRCFGGASQIIKESFCVCMYM